MEIASPSRFWAKVKIGQEDECWEWQGGTSSGYGMTTVRRNGRSVPTQAHRAAFVLTKGEIPAGYVVMHSCDNPPCVNPAHLRTGTYAENTRDCINKGRDRIGFRPMDFAAIEQMVNPMRTRGHQRLRRFLTKSELRPYQLARLAGISQMQLSHLITERRRPSLDVAIALDEASRGAIPPQSWKRRTRK